MNLINNTTNEIIPFAEFNETRLLSHSDIDFASYGYSVINEVPVPDHIEMIDSIEEGSPEFIDGAWYQTWIVTDTSVGMTPTELSVLRDKILAEMHLQLADLRYNTEVSNLTINGSIVFGDREARATLLASLTTLSSGLITSVDWKMANGWLSLTLQDITAIAYVMVNYVKACFSVERYHSETMTAITDVRELANYDFTAGWPTTIFNS